MQRVVGDIEAALRGAIAYDRINYLMLMMVDPHVHFHVIPRYSGERAACGITITDKGWPKVPALGDAVDLGGAEVASLSAWLRGTWPA
jgi:diadenosine tetraphosphate (Ap4A) HIT family hydrolase